MILPLLLHRALCFDFGPYVRHFDGLPPDDGEGYFLMLHGDGCQHCERLAPTWRKAAEMGSGLAVFGELSCSANQSACRALGLDGVPKVLYFRAGQVRAYPGMQLARLMVNWVSSFAPDTAVLVDSGSYDSAVTRDAALLFTAKADGIPKLWAGVERRLNMSSVGFFASGDDALRARLRLPAFPGVYAKRGSAYAHYSGRLAIGDVAAFLRSVFADDNKEL